MANIGLSNIWFANLTEAQDGTASYDGAKRLGKAVSSSVSVSNNEAKLYGDDVLQESDTTYAGGTITLGVTDDDDTVFCPLLGHTMDADGVVIKKSTDTAPYVGCGRIVTKMVNSEYKYKVEFLSKVKFSEPSRDENTKGESVEFSTPSVEGIIAALADGTWNKTKTFDTLTAALTWLQSLLGTSVNYTVTYNVNGGTGSVESETVVAGESVVLDDGSGITAPSEKEFAGWGTNPDATTVVSSPYTPTQDTTLYAVYVNEA